MIAFSVFDFAPVMDYPRPGKMKVFDLTENYDPDYIRSFKWGIGKYNERRLNMYTAPQYENKRNIHIGIDIWSEAGQPVFSFYKGIVCYMANHDQKGNYGPTLVIRYTFSGKNLYALFGHLSVMTLNNITVDKSVRKGEKIATIGTESENGGWPPHLHFQLCRQNPGKADMPGVVSEENRGQALKKYPDPRLVLGPLY